MGIRVPRIIALFFMLSLIAAPNSLILAQELDDQPAATPIVTEPEIQPTTPEAEGEESQGNQLDSENLVGTPGSDQPTIQSRSTDAGPLAELTGPIGVLGWDFDGGNLTGTLIMGADYEVVQGDTFTIHYSSDSLSLAPGPFSVVGIPATLTANDATEKLTITFTDDFVVVPESGDSFIAVDIAIPGTIKFPGCRPSETGYTNTAMVTLAQQALGGFWNSQSFEVAGDMCDPSVGPEVRQLTYEPVLGYLVIGVQIPETGVTAGTQLTITYPDHLLNVQPDSVDIVSDILSTDIIGSAAASDGVITITFDDYIPEDDMASLLAPVFMEASFNTDAICDPEQGTLPGEFGRLYFVASSGGTFTYEYSTTSNEGFENTILCDSAPASITAELSEDGTEIYWIIDSGDLINGGRVGMSEQFGVLTLDCESILIEPVTDNTEATYDCSNGEDYGIYVELHGEGVTRAIITYTTTIVPQETEVYVGCAAIQANGFSSLFSVDTSETHGLGAYVCASVFPPGGGDWVSNVASHDSLYQGDELTYQASFETSTNLWLEISLDNVLPPSGFEVTNVTCAFEPVELQTGDCEIRDDNTISVGLNLLKFAEDAEIVDPGPGRITLEITGTVTAAPGTHLISEACGERLLAMPGLPPILFGGGGSGVLCATTSTQVLQQPVPTEAITLAVATSDGGSPEGATFLITEEVEDDVEMSLFLTETPISGKLPASGVMEVGELAIGNSYTVAISGAPAGYQDQTGTFDVVEGENTWTLTLQPVPVEPDPTGTVEPDPVDPEIPATPGATPTTPAESDAQSEGAGEVTGLPSTGQGGNEAGAAVLMATLAASLLMVAAVGLRIRSPRL